MDPRLEALQRDFAALQVTSAALEARAKAAEARAEAAEPYAADAGAASHLAWWRCALVARLSATGARFTDRRQAERRARNFIAQHFLYRIQRGKSWRS